MNISRRAFVTTLGATAAGVAAGDALYLEPRALRVTRHDVPVLNLPTALEGLRVALVTDVHIGSVPAAADATLAHIAAEQPEVVVVVGDTCNKAAELPELTAFAREARGRLATFATYGNWERWARIAPGDLSRAYEAAGVELLVNEAGTVARAGARLAVVGFDDATKGAPDVQGAAAAESGDVRLWLAHSPGWVDRLPDLAAGVSRPALILSGHTHGGQVRAPFWTPITPYGSGRFVAGWYRDTFAPLYVSRGIGTTTLPVRLFCPPELPIFTLRASEATNA